MIEILSEEIPLGYVLYTLGILGTIAAAVLHWMQDRATHRENLAIYATVSNMTQMVSGHAHKIDRLESILMGGEFRVVEGDGQ